jgi:hypothetical protein
MARRFLTMSRTVPLRRRIVILVFVLFACKTGTFAGWILPNNWENPEGAWVGGDQAYDNNLNSYAWAADRWGLGPYIVFDLPSAIYCNQIRLSADFCTCWGSDYVVVDVWNGTVWTNVHSGVVDNANYTEIPFAGVSNVSKGRFAWHFNSPPGWQWWLYEFQFWSGVPPAVPTVTTLSVTSINSNSAIPHGVVESDGGSPCQFRFEYGTTTAYGSTSAWVSSVIAGDVFGQSISGLTNATTYHYRAQLKNGQGTGSGGDVTFTTGPVSSGWIAPAAYYDPGGKWGNPAMSFDDQTGTCAYFARTINDPAYSDFLYYPIATPILSDSIKCFTESGSNISALDVDAHQSGGSWFNIYEGTFPYLAWQAEYFPLQTIDSVRFRYRVDNTSQGFVMHFYEFKMFKRCAGAPTLSWTGETNYGSSGVYPLSGYPETDYTFRVKYTDACNAGPSVIQVWVDKNGDGDYTDPGEKIDLTVPPNASPANQKDGDYSNGEIFSTTINLDYGVNSSNISYQFVANNGTTDATGAPTAAVNYPDVMYPPQRTPAWSKSSIGTVNGGAITESVMYVGTDNSSAELICVDLSNGNTKWTYDAPATCKMPTYNFTSDGKYKIAAASGTNVIYVQDDGTGKTELWTPAKDLGSTAGNPYLSPDDATLYVTYTNYVTKINLSDKSVPAGWPVNIPNVNINSDMSVFNDVIYAATTDGKVYKIDNDGTPLATFSNLGGASVNLPLTVVQTTLFVTPDNSYLYAINTGTMTAKWGSPLSLAASNTGPSFSESYSNTPFLYVATGTNVQKIYDNGSTGTVKWTYAAGGTVQSGPIPFYNHVYFGRNGGRYYAIKDNLTSASLISNWPYIQATGNATSGPWIDQSNSRVIFGTSSGDLQSFARE